jgi:predicted HicB family RNase H-like nuclease
MSKLSQFHVRLPMATRQKADQAAAHRGISLNALVNLALAEYLLKANE